MSHATGAPVREHGSDATFLAITAVRVGDAAIVGQEGMGLALAQRFVHENCIRQAASSLGAAAFCVTEAARYAKQRKTWGKPLWRNQAIQFPLAELWTECEMVRGLVHATAAALDAQDHMAVTHHVAMADYRANRLACEAADRGPLGFAEVSTRAARSRRGVWRSITHVSSSLA
jgi:acyl-CoA dehydrogenase